MGSCSPPLLILMLSLESGYTCTNFVLMARWKGTRPVGLLVILINSLGWIILRHSVLSLSPLPFVQFSALHFLSPGQFISWTSPMHSFMASLMDRFIVSSLLGLLIPPGLIMSAFSAKHYMVLSKHPVLGSTALLLIFDLWVFIAASLILPCYLPVRLRHCHLIPLCWWYYAHGFLYGFSVTFGCCSSCWVRYEGFRPSTLFSRDFYNSDRLWLVSFSTQVYGWNYCSCQYVQLQSLQHSSWHQVQALSCLQTFNIWSCFVSQLGWRSIVSHFH